MATTRGISSANHVDKVGKKVVRYLLDQFLQPFLFSEGEGLYDQKNENR